MAGRLLAVADCGLGNLHSLQGALRMVAPGDTVELTADADRLRVADCVFLPGDGSFGACVAEIDARGLRFVLSELARSRPFFGICVGMQVLYENSEEAPGAKGLGVLRGTISKFQSGGELRVPLMGWLDTQATKPAHSVLAGNGAHERYYFLNSYYAPKDSGQVVLSAMYGKPFAAAVTAGPALFATQFHPEKSRVQGLRLLSNFLGRQG